MLFSLLLLAASASDWVPMRWMSSDPAALSLLDKTPINCILVEGEALRPDLVQAAHGRGLSVLSVVHPGPKTDGLLRSAVRLKTDGVVLEGDFRDGDLPALRKLITDSGLLAISMPSRSGMHLGERPVVATNQGVWPGIQAEDEGSSKAAPSGAPWINTNGGFLRFVQAAAPGASIWIGNVPPPDTVVTPERYMQAIADAAIAGGRWVISLDADFRKRLEAREPAALRDWAQIAFCSAWFEGHKEWRPMRPVSQLAIVQDVESGALYSGGVLDMIAVKHTPVRAIPAHSLAPNTMQGIRMAVNVDPSSLSEEQRSALAAFRRTGGATLSGPATWKFPPVTPSRVTLSDAEVKTLDEIWKEMNQMTGRRNLGVRLFNVSSMLSNLVGSEDGKTVALHLVNYSGYPVENVTVHLLGKYKQAVLHVPGKEPKQLATYDTEEGSGVDVDNVNVTATVVFQ